MLATEFKIARGRGVPLVAVSTSDPAETLKTVVGACNGTVPVACWDVATGVRNCNEAAVERRLAEDIGGSEDDDTQNDPKLFVTRIADSRLSPPSDNPTGFVVVMMMANRFFTDDKDGRYVTQAIANLRDQFKATRCTLVMLGHSFVLPPELQSDVMLIDEPLPCRDRLEGIAAECASNAAEACGKKVDDYVPAETLSRLADAVSGLPAFAAEQVVALSLSPKGCDVEYAWARKRKQIEATPGLSVHQGGETFADIGGVENVKSYLGKILRGAKAPKAVVFVDEIEKAIGNPGGDTSNVSQDFLGVILSHMQDHEAAGMIFVGPPGCLSGETKIKYRRGRRNSSRSITLKNLYAKFNGLPVGGGRGESKPWLKSCKSYLHSYCHESGKVFYNEIEAVVCSGVKECVAVTLEDGSVETLTADHLVLTPDGFQAAGGLVSGEEVVCRGDMMPTSLESRSPRAERVSVSGLKYYKSGYRSDVTDLRSGVTYKYKSQRRSRLVMEAAMNSLSYGQYLHALKTDPAAVHLEALPAESEVHHKNENPLDDRLENLEVLSKPEHTLRHNPRSRFNVQYTVTRRVVSVTHCGERETFDIQMSAPANNFATAGGMIVHNCSKSMVAKAAGAEITAPTIKLDLGAAKGSFVGQSESQIRAALKVIDAVSDGKALWLATCNGISSLPPELRRRFTLGTFFFDLPDANERNVIWKLWLKRAFGKSVPKGNFQAQSEGWTGAEIKQCVDVMERTGWSFDEARQYVVPVSISAADQIESLRRSASGRFLSASKAGIYYHAGEKGALESGKRAIKFDT